MSLGLATLPEELLERILSYCLVATVSPPPRPSWHPSRPIGSPSLRGRLALLLVSKAFLRICTPLFYNTIHIHSVSQLHHLLTSSLHLNPSIASHIRRIVLSGIWAEAGELLRLCSHNVRSLDLTLEASQLSPGVNGHMRDLDAEEFCEGLKELTSLTHIMVRKPNNVYLTQAKPRYVLSELAKAMSEWDNLEFADLAFRLSDDSGYTAVGSATRVSHQGGPITAVVHSLSTRPRLHTFCTLLPSVWNETILRVSANPALERIILGDGTSGMREQAFARGSSWSSRDFYAAPVSGCLPTGPFFESNHGVVGTGLFFMQSKKHARLSELIRAGTSIIRTRAQTLGTPGSPSPNPSSSSSSMPTSSRSPLGAGKHGYSRSQSVVPSAAGPSSSPMTARTHSPHGPSHHRRQTVDTRAWQYYPSAAVPPPTASSSRGNSTTSFYP